MFFNSLAFVFASGAINETSSPPILIVNCKAKYSAFKRAQEERTVMLIEIPRFSVGKLLLHHYKSDLAHISDFDSLVIGLSQSEI